ncbi:autotransporter domain-containing protein, partial [Fusobacterium varium]
MIEKIMKAVKRGNKRRGRNITIGAVVGFLLSCTAVMGEDNYLWIKGDSGAIEFNTTATTDDDGKWEKENPYSDNKWDKDTKTYTNNMILLSNGEGGNYGRNLSYGLRLSGELTDVNFVNNGSIIGIMRDTSSSSSGYGIYNSAKMSNIENTGVISGSGIYNGNAASYGYGIYNNSSAEIKDITNTGTISGFADDVNDSGSTASGHGIYNDSGAEIQNIKNTGLISGYGTGRRGSNGYGIYNNPRAEIKDITNIGAIINIGVISGYGDDTTSSIGSGNGYGIYNNGIYNNELAKIGNITNTGVISGYGSGTGSASSSGIYSVNNDFSTTSDGEIENITNTGIISGSGVGIYNAKSGSKYKMEIGDITNTGVIYGKDNAIKNNSGTIGTVDNYGILATQGDSVIKGTIGTEKNYGLYIGKDGKITVGTEKLSDDSI